jgi:Rad51
MTAISRWLSPLSPGRGALLWGDSIRPLAAVAAVWGVARGGRVLVVDAANRFDPYGLVRVGRERGLDPQDLLAKVQVARAFTSHQLVRLCQEELWRRLEPGNLLLVLGPVNLFYDEQVPLTERRRLFQGLVRILVEIKAQAPLLVLQPYLPRGATNRHFGRLLLPIMDYRAEVRSHGKNSPTVQSSLGEGAGTLAEVPPGAAPGGPGSLRPAL